MNIELLLVICISIFIGMLIEYKVKLYNKVEAKDYDILLNKYASLKTELNDLKTELNEQVYIGATYTNGHIDLIVYNCSDGAVWFAHKSGVIDYIDKDIFNGQFRLKENE